MLKVSISHQINPANAQNAALAFSESKILSEVITPIVYSPESRLAQFLRNLPSFLQFIDKEFSRRQWLPINGSFKTYPWKELIRIVLSRSRLAPYLGIRYSQLVDWVYISLDREVAKHHIRNIDAIYTYEDLALETFRTCKERGVICLYDLPIPFYRMTKSIMSDEAEKFPELASSIQSIQDPQWKLERKEEEVRLADHIFVASSITQRSLLEIGVPAEKITIIPYGAPVDKFHPQPKPDNIFRPIFVGRISPGKGVHYLAQAWEELNLRESELLFVGSNQFPDNYFQRFQGNYRFVASVPHLLLNQYYSSADVLVFPSLVEGFGLVVLEAMACGIPVIATANTGGIDIITEGVDGFVIPIRDTEALKEKILWCYKNRDALKEMGKAARKKAEEYNWDRYRKELSNSVIKTIERIRGHQGG